MLSSLSMFRKGWVWYGVLKWILERLKSWKEEEGLNQTMLWCCIISNKFTWTFKRFLFLSKLNNYKKNIWFFISLVVFFLVQCLVENRDIGVLRLDFVEIAIVWMNSVIFDFHFDEKVTRILIFQGLIFLNLRWNCTKILESNLLSCSWFLVICKLKKCSIKILGFSSSRPILSVDACSRANKWPKSSSNFNLGILPLKIFRGSKTRLRTSWGPTGPVQDFKLC